MATVRCAQCGVVLPDGARFCANCGRPGLYLPALIAERADGLVGRAWALDAVWQWLRDDGPRCLLVSGGPGSGKTALMAWLAGAGPRPSGPTMATQLAEVRQRLSAAHFCIAENHRGSVDPGRFTRLVFVQLADHHKLYADLVKQLAPEIVLQIQQEFRENWGQVTGLIVQTLNVRNLSIGLRHRAGKITEAPPLMRSEHRSPAWAG